MADEKDFIARAQAGDLSAFRELVEENKKAVYRVCFDLTGSSDDALDLSQEVFLLAYKKLDSFRGEAKFSSWLYRIAINLWLSQKRKKAWEFLLFKESNQMAEYPDKRDSGYPNPEDFTENGLMQLNISRALDSLSPRERSIFILRHYQDLTLQEIADILQIKLGTVKSLLFRAIKKLQKELEFYKREFMTEKDDEKM